MYPIEKPATITNFDDTYANHTMSELANWYSWDVGYLGIYGVSYGPDIGNAYTYICASYINTSVFEEIGRFFWNSENGYYFHITNPLYGWENNTIRWLLSGS